MGIHGLLPHLGPGERISIAKFSAQHYTTHNRPLRLAIDISIWLFQIQCGKGGSNPALRTFYYRLLRLMCLNIHPLFVFDGPNKPLFKRNKKVGGPGVKIATVPEFLAKQLLKEFGFPWHVAPGEAEAECALLQREGVVDAVLSEDVDTLMFGSGVTLRNWSGEGTAKGNKAPTHVNVYRADETRERSRGIDKEGMILVALMSGGDYIPEGVPGVGAKVACDAARAGFGKELCALHRKDAAGLRAWKERLETEIRTNASRFFTRKNTGFVMPDDFPSREVLGYYTHPCVSIPEKVERLRNEVRWDLDIDFAALRSFAADAFDWRCKGGAKKFIKNLAPALLVRDLRLRGQASTASQNDKEAQAANEEAMVHAIHGKRNHISVDGELEYRISFTPSNLVPIDLSLEDEDDEFTPAGGVVDDESEAESEALPSTQPVAEDDDSEAPVSPSKKRQFRPYYPDQPEKIWILRPFLRVGCPLLVEDYEASTKNPKEFLKQRRKARAASKKDVNIHATQKPRKKDAMKEPVRENALTAYARITKAAVDRSSQEQGKSEEEPRRVMKQLSPRANARSNAGQVRRTEPGRKASVDEPAVAAFRLPSTQIPAALLQENHASEHNSEQIEVLDLAMSSPAKPMSKFPAGIDPLRPFAAFKAARPTSSNSTKTASSQTTGRSAADQRTPKRPSRKRPPPDVSSPALSQRSIKSYYSPSPHKHSRDQLLKCAPDVVDLVSTSPAPLPDLELGFDRPLTPTPRARSRTDTRPATPTPMSRTAVNEDARLPDTVTKRRRKEPLKRWQTEPAGLGMGHEKELTIIISSSPAKGDEDLASPSTFGIMPGRALKRSGKSSRDAQLLAGSPAAVGPSMDAGREFDSEGGFIRDLAKDAAASDVRNSTLITDTSLQALLDLTTNDPPTSQMPVRPGSRAHAMSNSSTRHLNQVEIAPHKAGTKVKTKITLRPSLEGAWKEVSTGAEIAVETEMLDMTGNGSGWKKSGGRAQIWPGWRKSGVEVLDLTGA